MIMLKNENIKLKIGVFGGAFNPPHIGHVQAVQLSISQLKLDKMIIIPTGIPPHKEFPLNTPSPECRFKMTCLSFGHLSDTVISDTEISKPQTSYTIDTIENLYNEYVNAKFYLLMGSDMYLSLESWKDTKTLLSMVIPTVFARNSNDLNKINEYSGYLHKKYNIKTEIIHNNIIDISSSLIRESLPNRMGNEYIINYCYAYIIKNNLYKSKPNPDWLREQAYLMLNPKRIDHVYGCEVAAISLAKRWGVNPDDAAQAAILHDITKNFSYEQHLEVLEYHDIRVDIRGKNEVKLLHSLTGAIIAKSEFSAADNIVEAIRWHTTGKRNMTILDKIIYLADYIEETRDFPEVESLCIAAYENLDEAMIMGLELTIADIVSRGIIPNKMSLETLSDLKEG